MWELQFYDLEQPSTCTFSMTRYSPELLEDVMTSSLLSTVSETEEGCSGELASDRPWWSGQLDLADLAEVDPGRGGVLQKLQQVTVSMAEFDLSSTYFYSRLPLRRQPS